MSPQAICDLWKNHYSNLLNSIPKTNQDDKDFVNSSINSNLQDIDIKHIKCSVPILSPLLHNLSLRCSSGADCLSAHHLCYADPNINIYLNILFNLCLFHGVIPGNCLASVIILTVKNKDKDLQDVNNYRPIAVASTISKLFELFILHQINPFFETSHNQFGFKEQHSSDMSVFLPKQTVNFYVEHNTCVFSVFLDASKAFDRVNHYKLFKKIIMRHVPACFVRLLGYNIGVLIKLCKVNGVVVFPSLF